MKKLRILLVQTAFIGDVVLITALIKALHECFHGADLDVLVIPQTKAILQNNPYVREVLTLDKRKSKLRSFITTYRMLRHNKYDIAFLPHSSFTTALLTFMAGIKERVGFNRWAARFLLTTKVTHQKGLHKIQKLLKLLEPFSSDTYDMQTELYPSDNDEEVAAKQIENIANQENIVALAPGSVWETKCWEQDSYTQLAIGLHNSGYKLVFIGGESERDLCQAIIDTAEIPSINTAGRLSLLQSAALLRKCRLLVSNDSGALHLANAMRTTVYAFFGPTVKDLGYYPYRENDHVFETNLSCRPCGSHGHQRCPLGHHNCMKMIKVESVLQYIRNMIPIRNT